jgi:hypothetical protein
MNKVKTKKLFNEVKTHIQTELGYEVFDSFSDFGDGKHTIVEKISQKVELLNTPTSKVWTEKKYKPICEFAVRTHYGKETFIIWDWRDKQPFFNNENCVYDSVFGRYEFKDRESFYTYIKSDFGNTPF